MRDSVEVHVRGWDTGRAGGPLYLRFVSKDTAERMVNEGRAVYPAKNSAQRAYPKYDETGRDPFESRK